jgi:hypothetical protein
MPSANVQRSPPLLRQTPFYPPQWGVRGSDNKLGERLHTDGAIYYVNPNHPDADDNHAGTDPDHPLVHVAQALTLVQPFRGDEIWVMPNNSWKYGSTADGYLLPIAETVTVTVPGVRIVGVHGSSPTGVVWTATDDNQTLITVHALDVCIEGFFFRAPAFAACTAIMSVWNSPPYGDNLVVRHNAFDDTITNGVVLNYCWYADIHHNNFWNVIEKGIECVGAQPSEFLDIHDNIFHNCVVTAMDLTNCDYCHVHQNSIYNDNNENGVNGTDTGIITTNGTHNQVFDNYFSCILPVGAAGDYDQMNTAGASDAWINNHCMNGLAITPPV